MSLSAAFCHCSSRTHDDDYAFRIITAVVVKEVVLSSNLFGEFVHRLLGDVGYCFIVFAASFCKSLEVDVGILRAA